VPDGALSRVPAAEDRNRDRLAVVAKLLDTPVAGVLAIPEYLGANSSGLGPPVISISSRCPISERQLASIRCRERPSSPLVKRLIYRSCTLTYPTMEPPP
jgi:hypothetical protein